MSRLAAASLLAALLVGCVAQQPIGENQACPCAPGWRCDDTQQVCVVNACYTTCGPPTATLAPVTTIDDFYAALAGRWRTCSSWSHVGAPSDVIGIEFGPVSSTQPDSGATGGGDMYYLVAGPSGPERGAGFAYQLTYDVSGPPVQLNIHPAPNAGFGGPAGAFSPCPRELSLEIYELGDNLLLVPFPGE